MNKEYPTRNIEFKKFAFVHSVFFFLYSFYSFRAL